MQQTVRTWIGGWLTGLGAVAMLAREAFKVMKRTKRSLAERKLGEQWLEVS